MKLFRIAILTICASVISAGIDQLLERNNPVLQIEFDSDSNVYVTTKTNTSTRFHKLDLARNVTFIKEFTNVVKFFVTPSNNVYVFDNDSITYKRQSVYYLEQDSDHFKKIYEIPVEPAAYVHIQDDDGNIYFNTALGVALLQHDKTIPEAILNLEQFYINEDSSYVRDYYGYLYLGGINNLGKPAVAVINRDRIGDVPTSADVLDPPDPDLNILSAVAANAEEDVFVAFGGNNGRIVLADTYGFRDVVHAEYLQMYRKFIATEERFYFVSINLFGGNNECYLNFLHQEDFFSSLQFTRVPQGLNCDWLLSSPMVADSAGNLFIPYAGRMLLLRNNETEYRDVYFPNQVALNVIAAGVDKNDIVWVIRGSVNKLNITESLNAEELTSILTISETGIMKINDKTGEVFWGADENLFVYTED